jgi:hypothetical protein
MHNYRVRSGIDSNINTHTHTHIHELLVEIYIVTIVCFHVVEEAIT